MQHASDFAKALEFLTPETSPVWSAMQEAGQLFNPDFKDKYWTATMFFSSMGNKSELIWTIWSNALPSFAKLWGSLLQALESYPLRLARLWSEDWKQEADFFANLSECCVPLEIIELWLEVQKEVNKSARTEMWIKWVKDLVTEFEQKTKN